MIRKSIATALLALLTIAFGPLKTSWSQDADPSTDQPADASPPAGTDPADGASAPPEPQWTYIRENQNAQGTVTNTQRRLNSPDEGRYVREHIVTNPRGEMTQTWEGSVTEDGFLRRRSQTFVAPDGTLRQHEWSQTGTDPNNYTRNHTITLPDGRIINQSQTRSWDGTNGTMVRSFTGPNGQAREFERSWSPDAQAVPGTVDAADMEPASKKRWWQALNPFKKKETGSSSSVAKSSSSRRGFSIGTQRRTQAGSGSNGFSNLPPNHASQNNHRPSWAGSAPRTPHNGRAASASRPNPGRGRNR